MPPRAQTPRVFAIGLPYSGGATVAALFEGAGYAWAHHDAGRIAQDLAYAQATGVQPLAAWNDVAGFSDIFSMDKRHLPHLRVQDRLAYLLTTFPDAYFINTTRDTADWIAARFWADGGEHRMASAWHAGIDEAALPAHWMTEAAEHGANCAERFANHPRFIDFNVSSDPIDKLIDFLSRDFDLSGKITLPDVAVPAADIEAVITFTDDPTNAAPSAGADMSFVRQVADFCAQSPGHNAKVKALSAVALSWASDTDIKDKTDRAVALARDANGAFLLHPDDRTFVRAQGTLNELAAHGARPPLHVDMMDARFIGTQDRRNPPRRTVAYNRRQGAENLTLWPLPAYHTLAPSGQVGGFPVDDIPFDEKDDRCVWLGNITGRMSAVLTPKGRDTRGVYKIRSQMEKLHNASPEWEPIIGDLMCVPRYNVVKTLRNDPDFEVGLVLRGAWRKLADSPAFAGLTTPKQTRTWFHKFRYILSLSGNDTGSNFLSAAASNALILKEEDGWEVFYSGAFKPWVHYVPLAEGAQDVAEKLAWARANPDKAKDMAAAATDLFNQFANPNNRAAYLRAIAARLNEA